MSTQRPLTESERTILGALTASVEAAQAARSEWLDAKAIETSALQVGDDIYDLSSGQKVGVVTSLYRYTDTDMSVHCDYHFQTRPLCFDNTSGQPERSFGTREDAIRHADGRAARLRSELT